MVKTNTLLLGAAVLGVGFLLFTEQGKKIADDLMNKVKGLTGSNYAGAYAVDLRQLPYDPNNYYLPPRDSSILP